MIKSKLFDEWLRVTHIPVDKAFRPSRLYTSFKAYAYPRYARLSRADFYDWLRDELKVNERKDANGIIFFVDDASVLDNKMTWDLFCSATCKQFANWFKKNLDEFMFGTKIASDLYDKFLNDTRMNSNKVSFTRTNLSKQKFNDWLRQASYYYTGNQLIESRNNYGKTIKFVLYNHDYDNKI